MCECDGISNDKIQVYKVIDDVRRSCLNCKDFTSFRDDYFDDMEPDDEGFCHNGNSPRFGNEGAGCEYVCDWHNYA